MRAHHATSSAAQALYRIFVQPALFQQRQTVLHHATPFHPGHPPRQHFPARAFATSIRRTAKSRGPESRPKTDEEITARRIKLVDPATNRLDPQVHTRWDILARLDRKTQKLVQVTPDPAGVDPAFVPVCKIINKQEEYDAARRRHKAQKETRRVAALAVSVKTLELNWAIDANDLDHRLGKVREFLAEGRKVEIVLAKKRGGRTAEPEECESVLKRIRNAVDEIEGAREAGFEGNLGKFSRMFLQGKAVKGSNKDSGNAEESN